MNRLKVILVIIFILFTSKAFAGYDKLTWKNYEEFKNEKAVILYGVNWGRQWGCAGFENAQLHNLTFSRIDSTGEVGGEEIVLNNPSILFSKNISQFHAIVIEPGEYVLSEYDIKIARSVNDVRHIKVKNLNLLENGKPMGGSFTAAAGEIVYIGDFGLDCAGGEPIPWRYYIQKADFDSYVAGFKEKYKFVGDKQVIYRLFRTNNFGQ